MKELTSREVQLGELSVLKELAKICDKLNLRYYLFYGTLIGAARHQGFIPWDDDIDVAMPRADYDKLLDYLMAHEEEIKPLKLFSHRNKADYIYPIARLCDTRYYVDYQGVVEYGLGLFVDIYPLDGYGNTEKETAKLYRKNLILNQFAFQAGMKKFVKSGQAGWRTPIKFLLYCYAKLRGVGYFLNKLDRDAKKNSFEDSKFVNCALWVPAKFGFPREMFNESVKLRFEDQEFAVPARYHEILTMYYGDYMQLPPEEKRVGHHYYTAYLLSEEEMKQKDQV